MNQPHYKKALGVFLLTGTIFSCTAAVIFQENFETGTLDPIWSTLASNNGRCIVTTNFAPASGSWHMVLDDSATDAIYSAATATIILDVSTKQNIVLRYKAKSLGNDPHFYYGSYGDFSGLPNFDGVSISTDEGQTWRFIEGLSSLQETWEDRSVYLDYFTGIWSMTPPSRVYIRFSEYDNASAPLDGIAIDDVTIQAEDRQQIVLEIPGTAWEGTGPHTGYVMVAIAPTNALTVELTASDPTQVQMPAAVQIQAGETSAAFSFSIVNDTLVNLSRGVRITGSYYGYFGFGDVIILDDETPVATLTLPPAIVEGSTTNGVVTLDRSALVPMILTVYSPSYNINYMGVTVPAGQTNATFAIEAPRNNVVHGPITTDVVADYPGMARARTQITILESDVALFSLVLPDAVTEGTSVQGRIESASALATNIQITLSSTSTEVVFPEQITLSGWAPIQQFTISTVGNTNRDGTRIVHLTASIPGFTNTTASFVIHDDEVSTYTFSSLTDIVDLSGPVHFTVQAANIHSDPVPGFNGYVTLEAVLANGSAVPLSPSTVRISNDWTGEAQLPAGLTGPIQLRASDASGNCGLSKRLGLMRRCNEQFADLLWDPARNRFYATIPASTLGAYSNQVVVIDPSTAQITQRLPVAQDPGQLALTSGGEFIYVVLNANGTIARLNPASMTVESVFAVGVDQSTLFATDICTVSNHPNLLLVSRERKNAWPPYHSLALYENGAPQHILVSPSGGPAIEPSANPDIFFAGDWGGVKKISVLETGLTELEANDSIQDASGPDTRSDGDYLLLSDGRLVNGANLTMLGDFPPYAFGCPNLAANRVYFLESTEEWGPIDTIGAYDPVTFTRFQSLTLPRPADSPRSFQKWGSDGLALLTATNALLITSSALVPSGPAANLALTLRAAPDPVFVGAPLTYSLSITNLGPNIAVGAFVQVVLSPDQEMQDISASAAGATMSSTNIVQLLCGDLEIGQGFTLDIVSTPSTAGTLSCSAIASSESMEPNSADNLALVSLRAGVQTAVSQINALRVNAKNLVYDAFRGLIWATVPPAGGQTFVGAVVSIDPATGLVSPQTSLDGVALPDCATISRNGRYLFIGLESSRGVAQIDLSTSPLTQTNIFLGYDFGDPVDLEPLDGDGASFIATSSYMQQAFAFDAGARRPLGSTTGISHIERACTPDGFVGLSGWNNQLTRFTVNSSGITTSLQTSGVISSGSQMRGDSGLLWSGAGQLADANTLTLLATFAVEGAPCLDAANNRAYIAQAARIRSFNVRTLFPGPEFALPDTFEQMPAQSCIRWGNDGFALSTHQGLVWIGRWSAIPASPDSDGDGLGDDWERTYFGDLSFDAAGDADYDGICNGMEYLFVTSPVQACPAPMTVSVVGSGGSPKLRIEFPRRSGLSGLPYVYEVSSDLTDWEASMDLEELVLGTDSVDGVIVDRVRILVPATNAVSGFLRFKWAH